MRRRSPARGRLRALLAVPPAFVAGALLAMVFLQRPILLLNQPRAEMFYAAGVLNVELVTRGDAVSPAASHLAGGDGADPLPTFLALNLWKKSLPQADWAGGGIHYTSVARTRLDGANFTADRRRRLAVGDGWLGGLAAVLLALTAVVYYRARRLSPVLNIGLCPACGYDLRASPQRCPECGEPAGADGA
jgi:hypothetical protein